MTRESRRDFVKGALIALVIVAFAIPFIPETAHTLRDRFYNVSLKKSDSSQDGAASKPADPSTDTGSGSTATSTSAPAPTTDTTDTSSDYDTTPDYSSNSVDYTPLSDYSSSYDTYSTPSYDYSGYYNVDDNYVPSPNYSGGTVGGYSPTYTCVDGSYSYAQHSQGACSYHGGVAY